MQPRVIHLEGEPYAMGRQYGAQVRREVRALAEERLSLALDAALQKGRRVYRREALEMAGRFLPIQEAYAPDVHAEFLGIAEGAGITPELLLVANGLTDFRDVLSQAVGEESAGEDADECTAFWVRPEAAGGRTLCGQTWDMHATAEPFVLVVHRRPAEGPETLSLTTAGCLSLIGVNACGIAVGNNNLVPTDAEPGVIYLAMIHRALAARTWEEARAAIVEAPRASGHNYYLADSEGRTANIETTAGCAAVLAATAEPTFVHTNHYTSARLAGLAAPPDPTSTSRARERRMRELFAQSPPPFTPESIHHLLSDHTEGGAAICVHTDLARGSKSCGMAILCPQTREMWVRAGSPCAGALGRLALGDQ